MLCWGLFSTLPTNHTPAFVFFFKGKDKRKMEVVSPTPPCTHVPGLPLVSLFHSPPHVCLYSHLATEP